MDASVGAVAAAFVAGLISLLGLILGKEQKTSEFRQNWIDILRTQLVNYATNINSITDKLSAGFKDNVDKIASLSPNYTDLNKASFDIKLRVNPEEDESKKLLKAMDDFEKLANNEADFTVDNIKPIEARFIESSKRLLKHEWKRVKRGEPPFIIAKWIASMSTVVMAIIGIFLILNQSRMSNAETKTVPVLNVECSANILEEIHSRQVKSKKKSYIIEGASRKLVQKRNSERSARVASCER